jgi:DNA-binding ferritin-like protein
MTFDEYKEKPGEEKLAMTKSLGSSIEEYFSDLFRFQSQLKIMHWGTSSYAEHQAYGTIYSAVDELLDNLVESYQGCYGKLDFPQCGYINFKEVDVDNWLKDVTNSINNLREELIEDDLKNLLDEIASSVSKLKYLLTLK